MLGRVPYLAATQRWPRHDMRCYESVCRTARDPSAVEVPCGLITVLLLIRSQDLRVPSQSRPRMTVLLRIYGCAVRSTGWCWAAIAQVVVLLLRTTAAR
jgi:hypothetical protein